jgi:hypothetical protein
MNKMNNDDDNIQKKLMKSMLPKGKVDHRVYLRNAGLAIANIVLDSRISRQTVKRDLEDLQEAIDLAIRILGNGSSKSSAVLH